MDLISGGHRLNHGLNDNQEWERKYCDWVEDCESNQYEIFDEKAKKWDSKCFDENGKRSKFVDIDFDIDAEVNWGGKKCTWVRNIVTHNVIYPLGTNPFRKLSLRQLPVLINYLTISTELDQKQNSL